ncbi:MAG: hypothetical protein HY579_01535 [Nitrospinae bacterium]|nr:hypothetical protein [Nitrospinota bacterium]
MIEKLNHSLSDAVSALKEWLSSVLEGSASSSGGELSLYNLIEGARLPLLVILILLIAVLVLYKVQAYRLRKKRQKELEENLEDVFDEEESGEKPDESADRPLAIPAVGTAPSAKGPEEEEGEWAGLAESAGEDQPLFPSADSQGNLLEEIQREEKLYNELLYGEGQVENTAPESVPAEAIQPEQTLEEFEQSFKELEEPVAPGAVEDSDRESATLLERIEKEFAELGKEINQMEAWQDKSRATEQLKPGETPPIPPEQREEKADDSFLYELPWETEESPGAADSQPKAEGPTAAPPAPLEKLPEPAPPVRLEETRPVEKTRAPKPPATEPVKPARSQPEISPPVARPAVNGRASRDKSDEMIDRLRTFQGDLERRFKTLELEWPEKTVSAFDRPIPKRQEFLPGEEEEQIDKPAVSNERLLELLESFIFTAKQRKRL